MDSGQYRGLRLIPSNSNCFLSFDKIVIQILSVITPLILTISYFLRQRAISREVFSYTINV